MKKEATIIAVVNQKGGTAKTTTVENLGIGLSKQGKKVLLIDADPQASLTISLGYPQPDDLEPTLSDLLNGTISENPVALDEVLIHQQEGIDLIPSNISLVGLEVSLVNTMNRERILKQFLETLREDYDYILLDCVPSLGMLNDRNYHDIYYDGESHYYIDGSVYKGGKLLLLAYDEKIGKYYQVENGKLIPVRPFDEY